MIGTMRSIVREIHKVTDDLVVSTFKDGINVSDMTFIEIENLDMKP